MTEKLEFAVREKWQELSKKAPWSFFIPEHAKDSKGNIYIRRRGSEIAYKQTDNWYECVDCNSKIIEGEVSHAIWDSPIDLAGSGNVKIEEVLYCPKCEDVSKFVSEPIMCED